MPIEEIKIPIQKTSFNCPVPLLEKIQQERIDRNQPDKTSVIIDALNFYFNSKALMNSLKDCLIELLKSEKGDPDSELIRLIKEIKEE